MDKLFIAAETGALGLVTATTATSTGETKGSFFQRCFNYLHLRKTARLKADALVCADSQLTEESAWEPKKHRSPLYDLAASNPHIIAVSLFSRKYR